MNMIKTLRVGLINSRLELIDFLKGFSIMTIVLMHLIQGYIGKIPGFIDTAATFGGSGVHVFFLCSGLGLYISYSKHNVGYINFIKRRITKIYIPYIIVVIISALLPYMFSGSQPWGAVCSHIFLYKMFSPDYIGSFGNHFWFISTILQFYFVFIPIYKLQKRLNRNFVFFIISLFISVVWWFFVAILGLQEERVFNSFFLQYLWEFVLGMIIAEYLSKGNRINIRTSIVALMAFIGTGLMGIMAIGAGWLKVFNDIPALIGYTSIALLVYILGGKASVQFGKIISKISYEWYLVHILIFKSIVQIPAKGTGMLIARGVGAFILSVIAAIIYSKLLKRILSKI